MQGRQRVVGWTLFLLAACGDPRPSPKVTFPDPIPNVGPARLCESDLHCALGDVCKAGVCEAPAIEPSSDPVADAGMTIDGAADLDAAPTLDAAPRADAMIGDAGPADGTPGPSYDLSGATLVNQEVPTSQVYELPAGTVLRPGEVLLLVREATRNELEAVYGPLPASVQVLITGATSVGAPIINGGESFALFAPDGRALDETTSVGRAGYAYERQPSGGFLEMPESAATPGIAPPLAPSSVPRITEWADRTGTGQFRFELVEISYQP